MSEEYDGPDTIENLKAKLDGMRRELAGYKSLPYHSLKIADLANAELSSLLTDARADLTAAQSEISTLTKRVEELELELNGAGIDRAILSGQEEWMSKTLLVELDDGDIMAIIVHRTNQVILKADKGEATDDDYRKLGELLEFRLYGPTFEVRGLPRRKS